MRERLPDAALGSDIIVGFPGETDERYQSSLEYFAALPLTYFHVFPYSERRGTIASSLAARYTGRDQENPGAQDARAWSAKKPRVLLGFIGRMVNVLVEEKIDKATGLLPWI